MIQARRYGKILVKPVSQDNPWELYALDTGPDGFTPRFILSTGEYKSWVGISTNNIQTGIWYHLVGTYDGNRMKVYLNGVLRNITQVQLEK